MVAWQARKYVTRDDRRVGEGQEMNKKMCKYA